MGLGLERHPDIHSEPAASAPQCVMGLMAVASRRNNVDVTCTSVKPTDRATGKKNRIPVTVKRDLVADDDVRKPNRSIISMVGGNGYKDSSGTASDIHFLCLKNTSERARQKTALRIKEP